MSIQSYIPIFTALKSDNAQYTYIPVHVLNINFTSLQKMVLCADGTDDCA